MARGEAPQRVRSVEVSTAARAAEHPGSQGAALMERVVSRPNLKAALKRVKKNGSPALPVGLCS